MSDTPGAMQSPPPRFGEHNRDVLKDLGYNDRAIDAFTAGNIIVEAEPALAR